MAVGGREDGDRRRRRPRRRTGTCAGSRVEHLRRPPVDLDPHRRRRASGPRSAPRRGSAPGRSGALEQAAQEAQLEVREPERRRRQRVGEDVGPGDLHLDAVSGGVLGRRADGQRVESNARSGPNPSRDGGDREDARAAAEVERGRRLEPAEQLERGPGRAVGARPERAARVDDDGDLLGLEPRRADPELPDPDGPVKRPPGVLPAGRRPPPARGRARAALRRTLRGRRRRRRAPPRRRPGRARACARARPRRRRPGRAGGSGSPEGRAQAAEEALVGRVGRHRRRRARSPGAARAARRSACAGS